jgi:hypothetical protein
MLAKQGLIGLNNILAAREASVLRSLSRGTRGTCQRCLPSATSVVKFLLGRSLHPEKFPEKPNPGSGMLPYGRIYLERTGLIKICQRFLSEVCANGLCVAIHSNDKRNDMCHLSCLVLRGDTSDLEPPIFL